MNCIKCFSSAGWSVFPIRTITSRQELSGISPHSFFTVMEGICLIDASLLFSSDSLNTLSFCVNLAEPQTGHFPGAWLNSTWPHTLQIKTFIRTPSFRFKMFWHYLPIRFPSFSDSFAFHSLSVYSKPLSSLLGNFLIFLYTTFSKILVDFINWFSCMQKQLLSLFP